MDQIVQQPDGGGIWNQYMQRVRMWLAGVQYGGRRDLYELFGYHRNPRQLDYVARYLRQDIAGRVIDAPVLACWADPPILDGGDKFNEAWSKLLSAPATDESPAIFHNLIRADRLAGLGSFAGMVIGIDDGKKLDQPVSKANGLRKLLYLQPYAEVAITVVAYDRDQTSPRFNKPTMYRISPGRFTPNIRVGGISAQYTSENREPFNVHYSRFLHIAENLLEDSVYGRSRMERVVNIMDDLLKVAGGSAEMFWLSANRGMQADVDKEMELDPEDEDNLSKEIDEYQHDMRRFIRTRGVKISPLSGEKIDPTGVFNVLISLVSAATGIPKLVLIGTAQGQMASQQDRASWAERVTERITEYAEPVVFLPLLRMLVNMGVLPVPATLTITWQEAFKLSPLERAQTSAQMARSAANLTKTFKDLQPTPVSPGNDAQGNPIPPPEADPVDPLFSRDEMRNMVSFGRNMPVFDKPQGSSEDKTSSKSATKPSSTTEKVGS